MSPLYDKSEVERVREAVDIVEVIGDYVNLKQKRPGDWWGLCPFHQEKTGSFHVRTDRDMYHCFGCGKGGNVFGFLMDIEGISYAEAVRTIAERVGIKLTVREQKAGEDKSGAYKDALYKLSALAESHFHSNLTKSGRSKEAKQAYDYLVARNIYPEIISKFKLGWAETGWNALVNWTKQNRGDLNMLVDAGLAFKRKDGTGYVDRFRGRIMFPIHNLAGKPVAFGGRYLDGVTPGDDTAKYINTSETAVYHKGEVLYGLFNARIDIRKQGFAFLVEGYTDLLAFIQAEIDNVAASLGTALTQNQARLLKRFTSKVIIVYDSDEAGINAARRTADVLTVAGLEARMVLLPEGDDPDSLLQKDGATGLKEKLNKHLSFVQFHLTTALPAGSLEAVSQTDKLSAARSLLETIKSIRDPLQRDLMMSELSEEIGMQREALERSLSRTRVTSYGQAKTVEKVKLQVEPESIAERDLLRALLDYPGLISEIVTDQAGDLFRHELLKKIYLAMERACLRGETIDVSGISNSFTDPTARAFIAEALVAGEQVEPDVARGKIRKCIAALNRRDIREKLSLLERKIYAAQREGKPTLELMKELVELQKRERELK